MSKRRINLGKTGEDIAVHFLTKSGFTIIARNYRNTFGEIDIIALDGKNHVFIEVKTRSNTHFGTPEESVTYAKQKQIIKVAESYLHFNELLDSPVRFDVVAVTMYQNRPKINHITAAFDVS